MENIKNIGLNIVIAFAFISGNLHAEDKLFIHPAKTYQLSNCVFNVKTCASDTKNHTGIDYSKNGDKDIIAANDGTVVKLEAMSSSDHGMGNNIIIEHKLIDGSKIYSTYSHLDSYESKLYEGYKVASGEKIGVMGGSGYGKKDTWGIHLHFEMKTEAVTGSPKNGNYWGYVLNEPIDYGYLNPNYYISEVYAQSNYSGIFDGAGSLVSPDDNCWGCNKDEVKLHQHLGTGSVGVFQWLYDASTCSHIDIYSNENLENVVIKTKEWASGETEESFTVTLDAYDKVSIKPNGIWTTLAITTEETLKTSKASLYAYCKTDSDTFYDANRKDTTKDLVDVTSNYYWTGTGSLITQSSQSESYYGKNKDWAKTYESQAKNSFTSFQWYTNYGCTKVTVSKEGSSYFSPTEGIFIKNWDQDNSTWSDSGCSTLPCTVEAPSLYNYYIIKVKTASPNSSSSLNNEYLQVKCN